MKLRDVIKMLSEFGEDGMESDVAEIVVDQSTAPDRVRLYDGSDGEPFCMVESRAGGVGETKPRT